MLNESSVNFRAHPTISLPMMRRSSNDLCGDFGEVVAYFPDILVSYDSLSSIKFNEYPSNASNFLVKIALDLLDQLLYSTFYFY